MVGVLEEEDLVGGGGGRCEEDGVFGGDGVEVVFDSGMGAGGYEEMAQYGGIWWAYTVHVRAMGLCVCCVSGCMCVGLCVGGCGCEGQRAASTHRRR